MNDFAERRKELMAGFAADLADRMLDQHYSHHEMVKALVAANEALLQQLEQIQQVNLSTLMFLNDCSGELVTDYVEYIYKNIPKLARTEAEFFHDNGHDLTLLACTGGDFSGE